MVLVGVRESEQDPTSQEKESCITHLNQPRGSLWLQLVEPAHPKDGCARGENCGWNTLEMVTVSWGPSGTLRKGVSMPTYLT